MSEHRPGRSLPPNVLLIGTVTALFRDLHERDDPSIPCLRFEVKGSFVAVNDVGATEAAGSVTERRTRIGVTMYPTSEVSGGEKASAAGKELRKARDTVAGFAKSRDRIYLDVGGLKLEEGSSKGGAVKLRGLQDGSKIVAFRKRNTGAAVEVEAQEANAALSTADTITTPTRVPKAAAPVHQSVAASGILEPPRAARPLQKISALTFRASSSSTPARPAAPTSSTLNTSRHPAPVQDKPDARKTTPGIVKRPRNSSPVADPSQPDPPPAKRPATEAATKKYIAISREPAVFAENRSPPPRDRFLPASNSTQADSTQNSSFDVPASTPKLTSSKDSQTREGGSGLMKRSPVSPRTGLVHEDGVVRKYGRRQRPIPQSSIAKHRNPSPSLVDGRSNASNYAENVRQDLVPALNQQTAEFPDAGDAVRLPDPRDELDAYIQHSNTGGSQGRKQRQMQEQQKAEVRELERLRARIRELEGRKDASGLAKKTPPSPPSSNTLYWGGEDADAEAGKHEDDEPSPHRPPGSGSLAATRERAEFPVEPTVKRHDVSVARREKNGPMADRNLARPMMDRSPSPPGSHQRLTATKMATDTTCHRSANRTVQLSANAVAGPSRQVASSASAGAGLDSVHMQADESKIPQRRTAMYAPAPAGQAVISLNDLKQPFTVPGDQARGRPVTYTPLKSLGTSCSANVIGVVVSTQAPARKNDWVANLVITDPSLFDARDLSNMDALTAFKTADDDLPITIFRHEQVQMPPRLPMGSVFLIQDLWMQSWQNKPKGQSASKKAAPCCWLTGSGGEVLHPLRSGGGAGPYRVGPEEEARMRALARWYENLGLPRADTGQAIGARLSSVGKTAKSLPLCDLRNETFADITCKVLHVEMSRADRFAEVYVTDGTRSTAPHIWRNWHGIDRQIGLSSGAAAAAPIPLDAVYCLHIMQKLPEAEAILLQPGNVLDVRNVRCALYEGQLEMMWSELPTEEQEAMGWKRRKLRLVDGGDECVRVMNQRIRALQADPSTDTNATLRRAAGAHAERLASRSRSPVKSDQTYDDPNRQAQQQQVMARSMTKPNGVQQSVPMSRSIVTTYNDMLLYPYSTFSEIMGKTNVPNRYNVQARVKSIHPANHMSGGGKAMKGGGGEGGLVVKVCRPCERTFNDQYCKSCNDTTLSRASYQYRFIALLEPPPSPIDTSTSSYDTPAELLPLVIADEQAAAFLPALPPLSPLTSPNEIRTIERQIADCTRETYSLLLGSKMDGERVRPIIRWSVESYTARRRQQGQGKKGKAKGKEREREGEEGRVSSGEGSDAGVVAYRVFGMART